MNKFITKNLALFEHKDSYFKGAHIACSSATNLDDWVRVTEYIDIDFPVRDDQEVFDEGKSLKLAEIEKKQKELEKLKNGLL